MKIYIFGAGASLGSQDTSTLMPQLHAPLINNLFDSQYHSNAADIFVSTERIEELKQLIGDASVEEWLTKEWVKLQKPHGKEAIAMGRKLFGDLALYLWWTMVQVSTTYSDANGYHKFLQKLGEVDDKDECAFVNFNYDLLLDKALNDVYGYSLAGRLDSYTNYNYLKPHGSVNWFVDKRETDRNISRRDLYGGYEILLNRMASNMFTGEHISKQLTVLDPFNSNLYSLTSFFQFVFANGEYGFPVVLLPLSAKMYDLIDGFMERMRLEFVRIFGQATDVYVIGYRASDELFSEMTQSIPPNTKLHVVGRETADTIQEKILSTNSNFIKGGVYSNGFMSFIDEMR